MLRIVFYEYDANFLEVSDSGGNPICIYDLLDFGSLQEYNYIVGGEDYMGYNFDEDDVCGGNIFSVAIYNCATLYHAPKAEPTTNLRCEGYSSLTVNEILG